MTYDVFGGTLLNLQLTQTIGAENWVFAAVKLLAGKIVSELTYNVLSWTLNPVLLYIL